MNDLTKFNQLQSDLILFVTPVNGMTVVDRDGSAAASETLKDLKRWEKKVEEKRKELVGPLNDQVKRINEFAKSIMSPLADAESHLKKELLAFEMVLEKERQARLVAEAEERKKREDEARAAIQAKQDEAETLAMFADKKEAALIEASLQAEAQRIAFEAKKEHWDAVKEIKSDKVSGVRRTWAYRVVDESLVPPQFKDVVINDKRVKNAIIAQEMRNIPGLEIYQETSITARGV